MTEHVLEEIGENQKVAKNVVPAAYGARLLPQVVDEFARIDPNRVYASILLSADVSRGFRDVTMKDMARAVNSMAWWIKDHLGLRNDFETLGYLGVSDLRYPTIILAGIKCGWKVLLLGPRNSSAQNRSLLERASCTALLYTEEMARTITELHKESTCITHIKVKSFDDILSTDSQHFVFEKSFAQAEKDPILILHSSGSTGNPKLITMTHGTFSVTDNDRFVPTPPGRRPQNGAQFNFEGGGRFYSCFPPYHLAGIQATLILPIFSTSATIVLGPPNVPASGNLMSEVMSQQRLSAIYVPPSIIEQWIKGTEGLGQAKQLNFVLYGGGPLSPVIGDALSEVTDVCQMYGAAETGQIQLLVPQKGEWAYMEWNPYEEVDMQPSVDGAYEMVLHQDARFARTRSLSHNFPDVETWRTRDLFVPHPFKAGLWRFHARVDDLILLSNGHKIHPVAVESVIQGHPLLSGALVVGTGRSQAALLIEPTPDARYMEAGGLIDKIWPTVHQANLQTPGYGQIVRSKVAVADPGKPFLRAPKGTIVRTLTLEAYAQEIEALFVESTTQYEDATLDGLDENPLEAITHFLRASVASLLTAASWTDEDDLFVLGMDSLKATELSSRIRRAFKHQKVAELFQPSTTMVYKYPTVAGLRAAILATFSSVAVLEPKDQTPMRMDDLVQKYTKDLQSKPPEDLHVLLTGSTGSLGCNLLRALLEDSRVSKVYCLNRDPEARERQQMIFNERGFEYDFNTSAKTDFLQIDLSLDQLGLSDHTYTELIQQVDMVIHSAWKVDFNLSLESYETQYIRSVRTFVDFSVKSKLHPRIIFISSVSSVSNWATIHGSTLVPETPVESYNVASDMGYGQSKNVSERILSAASERCNIPVTILRIGQIAGPSTTSSSGSSSWRKDEWVPSLVQTSKVLKLIPSCSLAVDWIPVDILASIIRDISLDPGDRNDDGAYGTNTDLLQIYNLVNPTPTAWSTFVSILYAKLGPACRIVPLSDWVAALTRSSSSVPSLALPQQLESNPALKILPFFHRLTEQEEQDTPMQLRFETTNATARSPTMRALAPVGRTWMRLWCRLWLGPDEMGNIAVEDRNGVAEGENAKALAEDGHGVTEHGNMNGATEDGRGNRVAENVNGVTEYGIMNGPTEDGHGNRVAENVNGDAEFEHEKRALGNEDVKAITQDGATERTPENRNGVLHDGEM
ncbi:hypothetical protein MMC22_002954 [Lobaria immixta]|nr:hypothetical protein [Lobaria immixta]